MNEQKFLKRHLLDYKENQNHCSGKYVGSMKSFVESFMAVSNTVYYTASAHQRGKSKRLKDEPSKKKRFWFKHPNSLVPIPFNGCLFEIIASENWSCNCEVDPQDNLVKPNRKRSFLSSIKCPANIQMRTIKLFPDFSLHTSDKSQVRREKEKLRNLLLQKLQNEVEPRSKIIHYCRFPLEGAHTCHRHSQLSSHRLNRRVSNKIREYTFDGIHDIDKMQSLISEFVKKTLLNDLEEDEYPLPENSRYFPPKRVIHKHMTAAMSEARNGRPKSNAPPLVLNYLQPDNINKNRFESSNVGLIGIHGGAGYHSSSKWPAYQRLCDEACWSSVTCLKNGGTAGQAVTIALKILENSGLTNAGYGSNLTECGKVECDASIMDCSINKDGRPVFGAVTGVSTLKNPVCAAYQLAEQQVKRNRLSLGRIPPCVMSGDGAEKWAKAHKVEMCENSQLISDESFETWQKYQRKLLELLTSQSTADNEAEVERHQRFDTVGAVAVDIFGNVASAASSGGLLMKLPGRVGQSAMYGCGCWAENGKGEEPSVAVATTGCGEHLMYTQAAVKCAQNIRMYEEPYRGMQDTLLKDILNSSCLSSDEEKYVGMLALHQTTNGNNCTTELLWGHTTKSMLIGHMSTKDHRPEILISRLPEGTIAGRSLSVSGTWVKVGLETTKESNQPVEKTSSDTSLNLAMASIDSSVDPSLIVDGTNDKLSIDPDISLMYISTDVEGLGIKNCSVTLSHEYNRKIDQEFEKNINTRWEERVQKNPRLFNASKFRLDSVEEVGDKLQLRIGVTNYKDYMETNWSQDVVEIRRKGERVYGNQQALLAEPLGVAAIVVTSDSQVVFELRNHWVAEGAGKLDVPGGHPEPSEVAKVENSVEIELNNLKPENVLEEIFASISKEIHDELNIPMDCLDLPIIIGFVRNNQSSGRPVCYFRVRCSLSSNQIKELFDKGGAETDESSQIVFKDEKELVYLERDSPRFWSDLCPNGKAAVTLYSVLKQVEAGRDPIQMR